MKIHLLSDLHLEFSAMDKDYEVPDCDVIVLAGDIGAGLRGVLWAQTLDKPVVMIAGNHEFYGGRHIIEHMQLMKEKAAGSNVHVLNNEDIVIDGVRFICATLWTDFDLYGDAVVAKMHAQNGMNDYRQIHERKWPHRPLELTTDTVEAQHWFSRGYIDGTLERCRGERCVVVTHMAPSEQSVAPEFKGDALTPCFASNLEEMILNHQPELWLHGHVHHALDYYIDKTRVVCNPRGYVRHGEQTGWNSRLTLTMQEPPTAGSSSGSGSD